MSAHTKWLICSNAFLTLGDKCETRQKFVPDGYFFETGRRAFPPKNKKCKDLTGNDDDVTVVKGCKFKKGLTMVLPAVNYFSFACNEDGTLEDPRYGPQYLSERVRNMKFVKATIDGKKIDPLDAIYISTQDGDFRFKIEVLGHDKCPNRNTYYDDYEGCHTYAGGPYVFINTDKLSKGKHTLILIGSFGDFCSGVKHIFELY